MGCLQIVFEIRLVHSVCSTPCAFARMHLLPSLLERLANAERAGMSEFQLSVGGLLGRQGTLLVCVICDHVNCFDRPMVVRRVSQWLRLLTWSQDRCKEVVL